MAYSKGKKSFLKAHGLIDGEKYPSHDLFRYVFQHLDRENFAKLLATWLKTVATTKKNVALTVNKKADYLLALKKK